MFSKVRTCRRLSVIASLLFGLTAGTATADSLIYALNQVDSVPNQIYGYRIDATGGLTLLAGFPVPSGGTGSAASVSETIKYFNGRLYVINDGDDTLSAFSVNFGSGALTPLPFSPISLGAGSWACVDVHVSGSPVIVGDGSGNISSFVVTASTATQAAGSPYSTSGAPPFSCVFSRDGNYVYAGGNSGSATAGFAVSVASGVLTPLGGSPFNSGNANPVAYASDSSGRWFSTNAAANQVRVFTTSGGVPTGVSGNPFSAGGLVTGIAGVLHPAGFYMVADRGNKVGVYQVAGTGAATTLTGVVGSPFATGGSFTDALTLARNGAFLVTANGNSRNLQVFQVNASTGSLTSVTLQPVNALGAAGRVTGVTALETAVASGDFDGDSRSDVSVYRPSNGTWYVLRSTTGVGAGYAWGGDADIPVPGDYDGDGRTDVAVFRPLGAHWFILKSSTDYTTQVTYQWGSSADKPVPGDYDGDGRTDIAVFRSSGGPAPSTWFILKSSTNFTSQASYAWGVAADVPVPGDYDGDGKTDVVVYRPSSAHWFVLKSSSNFTAQVTYQWGSLNDVPVAADYDGDGTTDIAIYRPASGSWYILKSSTNFTAGDGFAWGASTDIPVPGDYEGDGRADVAVYRPSTANWYILKSSSNFLAYQWGSFGDIPVLRKP